MPLCVYFHFDKPQILMANLMCCLYIFYHFSLRFEYIFKFFHLPLFHGLKPDAPVTNMVCLDVIFGLKWFWVSGFGFQVLGFRFQVSGFWFLVSGFRFWVSGLRFWVSGFTFSTPHERDFRKAQTFSFSTFSFQFVTLYFKP